MANALVDQLYTTFLGRAPDAAGSAYWSALLDSGHITPAQLIQGLLASPEFSDVVQPLARLYFAAFDRIPDAAGLQYWLQSLQSGASLAQIGSVFAGSAEFQARYGQLSNADFIDQLYQNALGRSADAAGKAYWLAALASGVDRAAVLDSLANSPELAAAKGAAIQVIAEYLGTTGTAPTPQQLADALAHGNSLDLIASLYDLAHAGAQLVSVILHGGGDHNGSGGDSTPPLLSNSTPSNGAAPGTTPTQIVLNFNEAVTLSDNVSSNILVTDGASETQVSKSFGPYTGLIGATDTRVIAVGDSAHLSVSGSSVTITLAQPLLAGHAYSIQIADNVIFDLHGNPYAGLTDATKLAFTTPATVAITATVNEGLSLEQDSGISASDFVTNLANAGLDGGFAGTLHSGQFVEVSLDSGASWHPAAVDGNSWSYSGSNLAAGSGLVEARISDGSGQHSGVVTHAYTLDTTAPASLSGVSLVLNQADDSGISQNDNLTNLAAPRLTIGMPSTSGLAANDIVQIVDSAHGNAVVGSYTISSDDLNNGNWTSGPLSLALAFPVNDTANGSHTLTARLSDAAGNTGTASSASLGLSISTTAPTVASTSVADHATNVAVDSSYGFTFDRAIYRVTGGSDHVTITPDSGEGLSLAPASVLSASGEVLTLAPNSALAAGHSYTITVPASDVEDGAGNHPAADLVLHISTPAPVDTTPPTVLDVTTAKANGSYTSGTTVTIKVDFSEAVHVTGVPVLHLNAGDHGEGNNAVYQSGDGSSSLSFLYTVQEGDNAAVLNYANAAALDFSGNGASSGHIVDLAGNTANLALPDTDSLAALAGASSIAIDTTAPSVSIAQIGGDGILNAAELAGPVAITGTAEVGATVHVRLGSDGNAVQVTNNGGNWEYDLSNDDLSSLQSLSSLTVYAGASDAAGNLTIADRSITIDNSAPAVSLAALNNGGVINLGGVQEGYQLHGSVAHPDANVVLHLGGQNFSPDSYSEGAWYFTLTSGDISQIGGDGSYSFSATATDAAGNATTTGSQTATIDLTPPSVTLNAVAGNNVIDGTEALSNIAIGGSVDAGTTLSLSLDSHSFTPGATSGNWSFALTPSDLSLIGEGSHQFSISATDAAGNTTTVSRTITVDTVAPGAVSFNTVAGDNIVNASEASEGVTVSGSAEAGATVSLLLGSTPISVTSQPSGSWSAQLPLVDLNAQGQGLATLKATATDAAGNTSTLATKSFTIDTVAPNAPGLNTIAGNGSIDAAEASEGVSLSGSYQVGDTHSVNLHIGNTDFSTTLIDGSWHHTLSSGEILALGQGTLGVTVTALDTAGNSSTATTSSVSIDTVAPTLSSSSPTDGASGITLQPSIVLTFSENIVASAGSFSLVTHSNHTPVAANVVVHNNTVTITPSSLLTGFFGYDVVASADSIADAAGNELASIVGTSATLLQFTTILL